MPTMTSPKPKGAKRGTKAKAPDSPAPAAAKAPEPAMTQTGAPTMTTVTLLADRAIDTDRMMLEKIDTSARPLYSVSEMAQFFFARSSHWVRWLETENRLVLDGKVLTPIRTKSNARKYDLRLIEQIAHALASNGTIKANQLRQALLLVKIQAEMNDYL